MGVLPPRAFKKSLAFRKRLAKRQETRLKECRNCHGLGTESVIFGPPDTEAEVECGHCKGTGITQKEEF